MWRIRRLFREPSVDHIDRSELINKAIQAIEKQYHFLSVIGVGAYSNIIAVWSKRENTSIAVKIMHPRITPEGELKIWPHLKHQNIVPALKVKRCEEVDIFFMPLYSRNMMMMIDDDNYRMKPDSFALLKDWLTDILCGLEYLHTSDICHLDLKIDNIMITLHNTALIGDFGSVEQAKGLTDRYTLPCYYRPPEAWPLGIDCPHPKVDGKAFDVWSYGMIAFYIFSSQWMEPHLWGKTSWWNEIYPLIAQCLHLHFRCQLFVAFPQSEIDPATRAYCMNLVKGVLRYRPEDRPTPTEILRHVLLCKNGKDLLEPDVIWTDRHEDVQNLVLKERLRRLIETASLKRKKDKEAAEASNKETYCPDVDLNNQDNSLSYYCLCCCLKQSDTESEESEATRK